LLQIVYGTILPGEHIKEAHKARRHMATFGELTGGAVLLFTDAHGNHWERAPHGLRRLEREVKIC
jgi:hypothetical protein